MKKNVALFFVTLILISCSKDANHSTRTDSTVLFSTATTSPVSTEDINWDICIDASESNFEREASPTGTRLVVTCDSKTDEGTITQIEKMEKSIVWNMNFHETFGAKMGIKDGKMILSQWSQDERFVYLEPYFCCADLPQDYFFNYFQDSPALYRLDLISGKYDEILEPNPGNLLAGYSFEFSPNNRILASINSENLSEIHLLDLETNEFSTVQIDPPFLGGAISWSPDSKNLLITTTNQSWILENKAENTFVYFLFEIKSSSLSILFETNSLYLPAWENMDSILLKSTENETLITYDLSQKKFIPNTIPTP